MPGDGAPLLKRMGELWFVGAGLAGDRSLSLEGVERLSECAEVFAEEYTSRFAPGSLDRIAARIGRPVRLLGRSEVEGEATILDALRRAPRVGFVAAGDPFAATTHVSLRLAAERAGHTWRYVPNASVVTAAAGFLGLQQYRFGRIVSLPFPAPGFHPRSPIEGIAKNREGDLHSLLLLDLGPAPPVSLTASQALAELGEIDAEHAVLRPEDRIAVVARLGSDDPAAWVGTMAELIGREFGPPLHTLVVPARTLHFQEEAALRRFAVAGSARDSP